MCRNKQQRRQSRPLTGPTPTLQQLSLYEQAAAEAAKGPNSDSDPGHLATFAIAAEPPRSVQEQAAETAKQALNWPNSDPGHLAVAAEQAEPPRSGQEQAAAEAAGPNSDPVHLAVAAVAAEPPRSVQEQAAASQEADVHRPKPAKKEKSKKEKSKDKGKEKGNDGNDKDRMVQAGRLLNLSGRVVS